MCLCCACMFTYVYMHVEASSRHHVRSFPITFCFMYWDRISSLKLELTYSTSLNMLALGIPWSESMWALGSQTQFLTLGQQILYLLSHFPNSCFCLFFCSTSTRVQSPSMLWYINYIVRSCLQKPSMLWYIYYIVRSCLQKNVLAHICDLVIASKEPKERLWVGDQLKLHSKTATTKVFLVEKEYSGKSAVG